MKTGAMIGEYAYKKGRRDALSDTMTKIYNDRFDYGNKTDEARQAVSEVWFKMQEEYLVLDEWLRTTAKGLEALGYVVGE